MKKMMLAFAVVLTTSLAAHAQQSTPHQGDDSDSVISAPPSKLEVARSNLQDSTLNGGSPGRTVSDKVVNRPSYCQYDMTRPGCSTSEGGAGSGSDSGGLGPDDGCTVEVILGPGHAPRGEECR